MSENLGTLQCFDFQKEDPKALQQDLNLLWMHNLQWHFLEEKAKKQLKDQEKQAMVSASYTPLKLCLWEGILFSRPSARTNESVSVKFCFLNILKKH